jgi:hypothetical protein
MILDRSVTDLLRTIFFLLVAFCVARNIPTDTGASRLTQIIIFLGFLSLAIPGGIWPQPPSWYVYVVYGLIGIAIIFRIIEEIEKRRKNAD